MYPTDFDGNHLVLKYVFIHVRIGPPVLEHKIHRQRLRTLLNVIGILHPWTNLIMIFVQRWFVVY